MKELTLIGLKFAYKSSFKRNFSRLEQLEKLMHVGSVNVDIRGSFYSHSTTLTNIFLDDCCFTFHVIQGVDVGAFKRMMLGRFSNDNEEVDVDADYIMSQCRQLQRLGIRNATWGICNTRRVDPPLDAAPVPQEMLIKMVRRHSNLRWLRSDLSQENVAILKQERPEVTLVSD